MANNYNRFIKFDSYDLHSSSFEVVVLNMASIDSVVLNGATTKGMRFDVVFFQLIEKNSIMFLLNWK